MIRLDIGRKRSEIESAVFDAQQRASSYWDMDGLPTILAGATTVLLGYSWLFTGWPRSVWGGALNLAILFSLLFLSQSKKTLAWLKGRITYPRTGYVAPPDDPFLGPVLISIITEAYLFAVLFFALSESSVRSFLDEPLQARGDPLILTRGAIDWLVFLNGGLVSLACLAAALSIWRKNKKDPPWFEIAGAAIAGLAKAVAPVTGPHRVGIFLFVFGAACMAKGGTLLLRYLLRHPAPQRIP